jgi:hypothetical protein
MINGQGSAAGLRAAWVRTGGDGVADGVAGVRPRVLVCTRCRGQMYALPERKPACQAKASHRQCRPTWMCRCRSPGSCPSRAGERPSTLGTGPSSLPSPCRTWTRRQPEPTARTHDQAISAPQPRRVIALRWKRQCFVRLPAEVRRLTHQDPGQQQLPVALTRRHALDRALECEVGSSYRGSVTQQGGHKPIPAHRERAP